MIKLKKIIAEQDDIAAVWAKQDKQKADADFRQQQLIDKGQGEFRNNKFQPLKTVTDKRSGTSSYNSDKEQVRQIFDTSKKLPSTIDDWSQITPIADAMHMALKGAGSGDFLEQLKKIQTQTQLSALVKNWVYDGQTLFEWLEEEYTISWKQILDIIKPIQSIVGKYTYGIFDTIFKTFKSFGWKLEVPNNSLDSAYMTYGLWTIRRDSPIITYGNSTKGQIRFNSNLEELKKNKLVQTTSAINLDDIKLVLKRAYSAGGQIDLSFNYNLKNCIEMFDSDKTFYINFLPKKYKDIVYKHYKSILAPVFADARKWWIAKLNDPQFVKIFQRVNYPSLSKDSSRYTSKVLEIIKKYKKIINDVDIYIDCQYYNNQPIQFGGFYQPATGNITIMIDKIIGAAYLYDSPSLFNTQYNNSLKEEIFSTTIHEMQHALWDYHPLNPKRKWQQIQPYDSNVGNMADRAWYMIFGKNINSATISEKQIETMSKRYSISIDALTAWINEAKTPSNSLSKSPSSNYYSCDINEHQSRLTQFKRAMALNTADPIVLQHMIDALKLPPNLARADSNYQYWYHILICWVRNGIMDLEKYISWLNTELLVKQDINKSRKDNRTDFTQSA